jgi:putative nuclease YbcO-like protein
VNLRKAAAGELCEIRVPGECRNDPAYTVLAHVRIIGISGAGLKAPDVIAALGCDRCHDICDGRIATLTYTYEQRRLMLLEGMARTQAKRIEQGYICVKGEREKAPARIPKIFRRPPA